MCVYRREVRLQFVDVLVELSNAFSAARNRLVIDILVCLGLFTLLRVLLLAEVRWMTCFPTLEAIFILPILLVEGFLLGKRRPFRGS